MKNQESNKEKMSNQTLKAIGIVFFGLLGMFCLSLNPSSEATLAEFWLGVIMSKGVMAGCFYVAVGLYRQMFADEL